MTGKNRNQLEGNSIFIQSYFKYLPQVISPHPNIKKSLIHFKYIFTELENSPGLFIKKNDNDG